MANGSKLKRYRKVFSVLAKLGFDDIVARITRRGFWSKKPNIKAFDAERWKKLREALEILGPTYVKFGQVLSNRPGILPDELIAELSKLQDRVPPFPVSEVIKVIETDFGKPIDSLVTSFDETPLASASIAQVHKAVMHNGTPIVLKVQRPGIADVIAEDVAMLRDLAYIFEKYFEELRSLKPTQLVKVFEQSIFEELDFNKEKEHTIRFRQLLQNEEYAHVPEVFPELCSRHVIALKYVSGIKINQRDALRNAGFDLKEIARRGFDIYFRQIFEFGYFHADPHPGNILVMPDGKICLLDFGMVGRLSEQDKMLITDLVIGLGKNDLERVVLAAEKLQGAPIDDKAEFERDMQTFIDEFGNTSVKDLNLNDVLIRTRALVQKYNLQLNPDMFLLLRSTSMLEGLGISLDPNFRSLDVIKPYASRLLKSRAGLKNIFSKRKVLANLADVSTLLMSFPDDYRRVVGKIKNDNLKVTVDQRSFKLLQLQIKKGVNKLYAGILIASFLIGGFIASLQTLTPQYFGLPMLSWLAFGLAGIILVFQYFKKE
ncbi:MAG: ABC1 kinase family protein [Flavobacteriales bacterium]